MDADSLVPLVAALFESYLINFAFSTLLFYEFILCFDQEVEYFWSGSWSLSNLLYLTIRYMSLGYAMLTVSVDRLTLQSLCQSISSVMNAASRFRTPFTTTVTFIKFCLFAIPIGILSQSVITLRVWYLFHNKPAIKIFSVALLFVTALATILLVATQWAAIRHTILHPNLASLPSFAWIYVPSLVAHTILFALKVYRFLTSPVSMKTDSLLWGFVKEGMFMYMFALVSLLFGVVGLAMVEPSQIYVRMPAAIASPVVAAIAVSVCRVMISIRSIAATAHVDPAWLLNHAELSRVQWRLGDADGEIIVESGELPISLSDTKFSATLVNPAVREA